MSYHLLKPDILQCLRLLSAGNPAGILGSLLANLKLVAVGIFVHSSHGTAGAVRAVLRGGGIMGDRGGSGGGEGGGLQG